MNSEARTYIVLYRDSESPTVDVPWVFMCEANDADHAEEQCLDAEPNVEVLWIFQGDSVQDAYLNYWGSE